MHSIDLRELKEYEAALRLECEAWRALAGRIPGSPNYCEEAWRAWLRSVDATNEARAKWVKKARFVATSRAVDRSWWPK